MEIQEYGRQLGRIAAVTGGLHVARRFADSVGVVRREMERYRNSRKRARKNTKITDPSGYNQFERFYFRSGRKRSLADKRQSILNTIIANYRLRISRINDLSVGNGAYYLGHGPSTTVDRDVLPILLCNLTSVRQGNSSARPMSRMRIFIGSPNPGNIEWETVASTDPGGSAPNEEWQYEDNEGALSSVGRKSFLDWIRIKLTIWGKQNAPGRVQVKLVSFTDAEYCPESYSPSTLLTDDARNFWASQVKPLITNPTSSMLVYPKRGMKVHKKWDVEFDPISTTEADQDPHCKCLDIFHRVGRTVDYTTNDATLVAPATLEDADAYPANDGFGATKKNYGVYPSRIEDSLYLMITSMAQDKYSTVPSKANEVSIDWNIQACHKSIQPNALGV